MSSRRTCHMTGLRPDVTMISRADASNGGGMADDVAAPGPHLPGRIATSGFLRAPGIYREARWLL
jgi:hypothetical protein